jgi:hypothetical protein
VPSPLVRKWFRPTEFTAPLPDGGFKNGSGRDVLAATLRATCPMLQPTTDSVVVHVIAELPPRHVIADVDNLLKPVLDALKGIAWVDDTQVCELLVRRMTGHHRRLQIKVWQIPGAVHATHLNSLAQVGANIDI